MKVYQHGRSETVHLVKGCNGATKPVHLCMKCSKPLAKQTRIYRKLTDVSDVDFHEHDGTKGRDQQNEEPPHAIVNDSYLRLSKSAMDLNDVEMPYVKAYVAGNAKMIGLKPVSGADVTQRCLSARGGRISFEGLNKKIDIDFRGLGDERFEVAWEEDENMFVVDFSAKSI